jgi:hypothetical protein
VNAKFATRHARVFPPTENLYLTENLQLGRYHRREDGFAVVCFLKTARGILCDGVASKSDKTGYARMFVIDDQTGIRKFVHDAFAGKDFTIGSIAMVKNDARNAQRHGVRLVPSLRKSVERGALLQAANAMRSYIAVPRLWRAASKV